MVRLKRNYSRNPIPIEGRFDGRYDNDQRKLYKRCNNDVCVLVISLDTYRTCDYIKLNAYYCVLVCSRVRA